MTEQELMWAKLRNDWGVLSHTMGQELAEVSQDPNFLKQADKYLNQVMDLADPITCTRVVATWLKTYNLPFEPNKMESFSRFDGACRDIIISKSYGGEYPLPMNA